MYPLYTGRYQRYSEHDDIRKQYIIETPKSVAALLTSPPFAAGVIKRMRQESVLKPSMPIKDYGVGRRGEI